MFQFVSPLARLMHITPLISGQVTTRESLRNQKGAFVYVFPVSAPHGISPRAAWAPSARCWDTTLVRLLPPGNTCGLGVTCVLVSCVSGAVNSHPPVRDVGRPFFLFPRDKTCNMCVPISVTVSAEQHHSPAPNLHLNQTQVFSSLWGSSGVASDILAL